MLARVDAALAEVLAGPEPAMVVTHHGVLRLVAVRAGADVHTLIPNLGGYWFGRRRRATRPPRAAPPLTAPPPKTPAPNSQSKTTNQIGRLRASKLAPFPLNQIGRVSGVRAEGARLRAIRHVVAATAYASRVARPGAREPDHAPAAAPVKRRPTATSNFGAGRRESHDATAFYERFEAPTLSGDDAVVEPYAIERAVRPRRRPSHGRDPRRLRRAGRDLTAVLRGQAVRGRARARRRAELVRRVPPAPHRRVRRVRASSSRAVASRSTSPTSAASPTAASPPTSSASCKTSSACCCAAKSCGKRARVRPAAVRGARSAVRPTPFFAISPSGSSSRARAASIGR